jgi:hypothetical protein
MNCIKEMSLDETAEAFHSAGYNVLLYDCRSVGGSEGKPRNQIDPAQMAQDISGKYLSLQFTQYGPLLISTHRRRGELRDDAPNRQS